MDYILQLSNEIHDICMSALWTLNPRIMKSARAHYEHRIRESSAWYVYEGFMNTEFANHNLYMSTLWTFSRESTIELAQLNLNQTFLYAPFTCLYHTIA